MKAAKNRVQWGSFNVSLDRLSFLDRLFIASSLVGILLWAFPHVTIAQSLENLPMIFEINNLPNAVVREDYLARALAKDIPSKPVDPRIPLLQQYLIDKNSPLAKEAEVLLAQYHYRLILGISFAESNFCKYQIMPNNCWGIGGGNPERYPSLSHGIIRANELIQKYFDQGMTNPNLMRNTWVGWPNHNWAVAVQQVTLELEQNGL